MLQQAVGQINRGSALGEHIYQLAKNPEVKNIVEIGTWNGMGSTKCIYDAVLAKKNFNVISLECNLERHKEAKMHYNIPLNNFNLIYGTITTLEEIMPLIEKEKATIKELPWLNEESMYLNDAPFVLDMMPTNIDLLILDGGEFSSAFEFQKLYQRSRFIVLDDTSDNLQWIGEHILKNSEIRKFILSLPNQFAVIADDQKDRNGYFVCENLIRT